MSISKFKIESPGKKTLEFHFIQGGMGVGVSMSGLASAVADEGGAGIIASVGLGVLKGIVKVDIQRGQEGYKEAYEKAYIKANQEALRNEIREARRKTNGVIGVNIMHALSDYSALVEAAVDENADMIISGAGIPRDLPKYLRGRQDISLIPIVASAKLARLMIDAWERLNYTPRAIIVEGPKAGGHLGYSYEQLMDLDFVANGLERIVREVVQVIKESGRKIPVIAAGGLFYGGDIRKALSWGADLTQMATRFVPTDECDAADGFKNEYLRAKPKDIEIIKSPVGLPGRAIINPFLRALKAGERPKISCDYKCLKSCGVGDAQYCIANALVEAQGGDFRRGYAFCGLNAYLCDKIIPVSQLVRDLDREFAEGKVSS